MRILVTGAAGFLGSHLARELAQAGHTVAGVDREDGDLRDPRVIAAHLDAHEPDVVCHLAAKVGRLFGEVDVAETVADNAGMTATVARACGERGVRVAYASTSEVYGDHGDRMVFERGPFRLPHNTYGLSKRWGEEACELYAPDGLLVWRFSMPYGEGHPPGMGRAAITNMLWQAATGQEIPVHVGAERSWCYVGDTVRAARMTLEASAADPAFAGAWNVGRDDEPVRMRHVAELACLLTGGDPALIRDVPAPGRQTVVKRLGTVRLRQLGWGPQVGLVDGMTRVLAWLRDGGHVPR